MEARRLMPIRPENRARYPKDWPAISLEVRERARWRCEGSPAFPECRAQQGNPHPRTGGTVVLTVGHLDHTPENNGEPGNRPNLKAWCQRCHNTYDAPTRRAGVKSRARAQRAAADLFADAPT
jgi:5-methylcytosine-specific restriction endonuclease McrA